MKDFIFLESKAPLPLMDLPVRASVIPLENRHILISPGSQLSHEQLKILPKISDLVAPNLLHTVGIPKAQEIFNDAITWGPERAKELKPHIKWDQILTENNWPYQNELPLFQISGMPQANECVFIHKKSKTLIVTDLCFNLQDAKGFFPWIFLSLFGTYRKFGVSRMFLSYVKDKEAFQDSLAPIFEQDFENIVLSHGYNIVGGAKDRLKSALSARGIKLS